MTRYGNDVRKIAKFAALLAMKNHQQGIPQNKKYLELQKKMRSVATNIDKVILWSNDSGQMKSLAVNIFSRVV